MKQLGHATLGVGQYCSEQTPSELSIRDSTTPKQLEDRTFFNWRNCKERHGDQAAALLESDRARGIKPDQAAHIVLRCDGIARRPKVAILNQLTLPAAVVLILTCVRVLSPHRALVNRAALRLGLRLRYLAQADTYIMLSLAGGTRAKGCRFAAPLALPVARVPF